MAAEETIAILHRYLLKLREEGLPVAGLVLYGSYARGEAGLDSDIDVLVLLEGNPSKDDFFELWRRLERHAHAIDLRIETWPVTVTSYETDEVSPLILIARQEGIRIAA